MKLLTLTPHEIVAAGDIITAIQEAALGQKTHVVLYALGKAIAISFKDLPHATLVDFLSDLNTTTMVLHSQPNAIPPEPGEE